MRSFVDAVFSSWPRTSISLAQAIIGDITYVDLLEHTFVDNSEHFTSGLFDEEAQWVRVIVAMDVGFYSMSQSAADGGFGTSARGEFG